VTKRAFVRGFSGAVMMKEATDQPDNQYRDDRDRFHWDRVLSEAVSHALLRDQHISLNHRPMIIARKIRERERIVTIGHFSQVNG